MRAVRLGTTTEGTAREAPRAVAAWLLACCGLIFAMVVVGGITRLTLSGLSITEWEPVTGVIPPLTHAQWAAEFARYQQIPEYRLIHYGMSLAEFKGIYFWEYAHRLLGRLIGFAFAVPLCWFWLRGRLPPRLAPALLGILALGFAQGALGWYMVESGLVHRVEVSQYRLVAHLALALAIYSLILWTALNLLRHPPEDSRELPARPSPPFRGEREGPIAEQWEGEVGAAAAPLVGPPHPALSPRPAGGEEENGRVGCDVGNRARFRPISPLWRPAANAVIILVTMTILAGGFVAGTRAGFAYNTFPLMDGRFVPAGYAQLHPFIRNWFENIAAIQFNHRILAMTTAAAIVLLCAAGWREWLTKSAHVALWALLGAVALQVTLGISTLLLVVPIPLAVAHQAAAVILLSAALVFRHTLRRAPHPRARAA